MQRLPPWAGFYVRLGAEAARLNSGLTVFVSVPRRECVAGLVATGAVLARETSEWAKVTADPGQGLKDGDAVALVAEPWCTTGDVWHATDSQIKVRCIEGLRTYEGIQRCAIAPCSLSSGARKRVPDGFGALIHEVFCDRVRAKSFMLREIRGCVVAGASANLVKEWHRTELVGSGDEFLTVAEMLQPTRDCGPRRPHVMVLSDRHEVPHEAIGDGVVRVLDGYRAWARARRSGCLGTRIAIIDRSDDLSYAEAVRMLEQDMNSKEWYDPFGNAPDPPRGIEIFTYRRPPNAAF
jgi:hypothetical protein